MLETAGCFSAIVVFVSILSTGFLGGVAVGLFIREYIALPQKPFARRAEATELGRTITEADAVAVLLCAEASAPDAETVLIGRTTSEPGAEASEDSAEAAGNGAEAAEDSAMNTG